MELLVTAGLACVLILVGLGVGGGLQWRHFADLARREKENEDVLLSDIRTFPGGADPAFGAAAVLGECVIGTDYFKTLCTKLRNLFGGELKGCEQMFERARREALLRMVADARSRGFDAVCNVRFGTSQIGCIRSSKKPPIAEVFATGTAYRRPAAPAPLPPA